MTNEPFAQYKVTDEGGVIRNLVDIIYPIGSIYWSSKSTNPSTLFGGTWTQITDKFIYAAGTKSVNTTGGSETVTLTTAQIPTHSHSMTHGHGLTMNAGIYSIQVHWPGVGSTYSGATPANGVGAMGAEVLSVNQHTGNTGDAGSSGAHNNMPPYVVKYCWERTA